MLPASHAVDFWRSRGSLLRGCDARRRKCGAGEL